MKYFLLIFVVFTAAMSSVLAQKEVAVLETNYISDFYSGKESIFLI